MDHERMLDWADGHLKRLEVSSYAFFKEHKPYAIRLDENSIAPEHVVRLRENSHPPFPDEWVFLIGDAVHNMRVSLDYLAGSLVLKKTPTADEGQIAFPIDETGKNYGSIEGLRIGGAPAKAKQIIKALQPYHRRHSSSIEPLAALNALENIHKHRRLLSAGVAISNVGYRTISGRSEDVVWSEGSIRFSPLSDGAEVARYTITNPETRVEAFAQFHICFDDTSPVGDVVVLRTLKMIRDHIREDIFKPLKAHL